MEGSSTKLPLPDLRALAKANRTRREVRRNLIAMRKMLNVYYSHAAENRCLATSAMPGRHALNLSMIKASGRYHLCPIPFRPLLDAPIGEKRRHNTVAC